MSHLRQVFAVCMCVGLGAHTTFAQDQENFDVSSSVQKLTVSQLYQLDDAQAPKQVTDPNKLPKVTDLNKLEPFNSGFVDYRNASQLLSRFAPAAVKLSTAPIAPAAALDVKADTRVILFHLLRWGDAQHKTVAFEQWYIYDPNSNHGTWAAFDFASKQALFQRAGVSGRQAFRLIYVHLNYDLGVSDEWLDTISTPDGTLKYPVSYKIQIEKQKTQLQKDFLAVLQLAAGQAGLVKPQANEATDYTVGYYAVYDFESRFDTSSLTVTASLKGSSGKGQDTTTAASGSTTANNLSSKTISNEKPSWFGLSFTVPLTSYKDVTYDESAGVLQPQTINRENIYLSGNLYLPPVEPAFTNFRWFPHLIFGLPIKSQPLRHSMIGLGLGVRWLEPFAGIVFDVQSVPTAVGSQTTMNHTIVKGVWGLNVSVSSVVTALSKGSGSDTSTGSGGKSKTAAKK